MQQFLSNIYFLNIFLLYSSKYNIKFSKHFTELLQRVMDRQKAQHFAVHVKNSLICTYLSGSNKQQKQMLHFILYRNINFTVPRNLEYF